jgi:hypothetical protein
MFTSTAATFKPPPARPRVSLKSAASWLLLLATFAFLAVVIWPVLAPFGPQHDMPVWETDL